MAIDVSVIICAYAEERWGDLLSAVESVQSQTVRPREIIVVIDHNTPLLTRAQEQLADTLVIENREMWGASGARNSGAALAQGAILAFLDDDAVAEPDWLENLSGGYSDPQVMGVGGFLKSAWSAGCPAWFPDEFNWVVGCSYTGMPDAAAPVRNLIAANMSVRRCVFWDIGGFRKGFGKVGTVARPEETELCIRISQRWPQGIWLYEPRAAVHHHVPRDRARWRYFVRRCYHEGLGKAELAAILGAQSSLSSEREYVHRTLPAGVLRGIVEALYHGDASGLLRSGAILAGLTCTTMGYAIGVLGMWLSGHPRMGADVPAHQEYGA